MASSGFLADVTKCLRIFLDEHRYECQVRVYGATGPATSIGLKVFPADDYYHGDYVNVVIELNGAMGWRQSLVPPGIIQQSSIYREDALPKLLEFLDKAFCKK